MAKNRSAASMDNLASYGLEEADLIQADISWEELAGMDPEP